MNKKKIGIAIFVILILTVLFSVKMLWKTKQTINYNPKQTQLIQPHEKILISCTSKPTSNNQFLFTCADYSLTLSNLWRVENLELTYQQLPKGWLVSGTIPNNEFANYDESTAQGRSYDANQDKGKQKFAAFTFNTTKNLDTLATDEALLLQEKIISITPVEINNYRAIKIYAKNPLGYNVIRYYIQNPSKNTVADISPIFGFNNEASDFQKEILSSFTFHN